MSLEIKIYLFIVFVITILFIMSGLRWMIIDGRYYFRHHVENCGFGAFGIALSILLAGWMFLRLLSLIAIWWFNI